MANAISAVTAKITALWDTAWEDEDRRSRDEFANWVTIRPGKRVGNVTVTAGAFLLSCLLVIQIVF